MDSCLRVDADEPDASPLKDTFPEFPGDPQGGDEYRSRVARADSLIALPNTTNDVVTWRLDFNRYPLAVRSDS